MDFGGTENLSRRSIVTTRAKLDPQLPTPHRRSRLRNAAPHFLRHALVPPGRLQLAVHAHPGEAYLSALGAQFAFYLGVHTLAGEYLFTLVGRQMGNVWRDRLQSAAHPTQQSNEKLRLLETMNHVVTIAALNGKRYVFL